MGAAGFAGPAAPTGLMSGYDELLAAVKEVRDRTGDPNAWQAGLAPSEVAAVLNPTTRPEQVAETLRKIRQHRGDAAPAAAAPAPSEPPDRERGEAAEAIARAEASLAHQNSASSQLDMQVVSAILNAHLQAVDGKDALIRLQHETEVAVQTRSDLDTPAGARDFQRFLIGKLRDIRAVVLNASLDDTSKSALMAAWTSLYDASKNDGAAPGQPTGAAAGDSVAADGSVVQSADEPETDWDPLLDSLWDDDVAGDDPGASAWAPAPSVPAGVPPAPSLPSFGAGSLPGLGGMPAGAGWEPTGGLPFGAAPGDGGSEPAETDDEDLADAEDPASTQDDGPATEETAAPDQTPPGGPTLVTLPDGDTVTAANPQLAAAITAAVAGTPIADAFQRQGLTLPPPGTPVPNPVDPARLAPGDIGILVDRHAVALGPDKALLDGQIQHIATVSGPSFLGWEHPPAPAAATTAPVKPDAPAPTRPATSSTT